MPLVYSLAPDYDSVKIIERFMLTPSQRAGGINSEMVLTPS